MPALTPEERERLEPYVERLRFQKAFERWLRATDTCFERDVLRDCKEQLYAAWKRKAKEDEDVK